MIGKICGLKRYVEAPPEPTYRTMTAIIDLTNSNPATCISYADDAVDMEAKSDAWDEFFGHYPVLFKEGQEVGKLDKNDFSKFESGASADIMTGNAGDVMIAFPRRGLKIETSEDGNTVTVSMTDNPDDENFKYYAHTRGETRKKIFYLGAYKGYILDNKLRSLSGKTPSTNISLDNYRTYAHNNSTGYEQSAFYQLTYRQAMYVLKYKNLNSQEILGLGFVKAYGVKNTGNTDTKGMDFGETTGLQQIKLFGLEDFYGNVIEYIEGFYCSGATKHNILTTTDNFNSTGSGFINNGSGISGSNNIHGNMVRPQGTSETGFIAKTVVSNNFYNTYFCSEVGLYSNNMACFGGYYSSNVSSGVFSLDMGFVIAGAAFIGARLMYL